MTQRKEKHVQDFIEEINRIWQLSINEEDFLKTVLKLVQKRESDDTYELVENYLAEKYTKIIDIIPNSYIRDFAEDYLDMVDEDDCKCDLEYFSDYDILKECEERGIDVVESSFDIVTDSQVSEMMDLFLSFSPQKRQDVINDLNFGNK